MDTRVVIIGVILAMGMAQGSTGDFLITEFEGVGCTGYVVSSESA